MANQSPVNAEPALLQPLPNPPLQWPQVQTERVWSDVASLTPDRVGQSVLVRARVHNVRGKGKSCFLVLRQATATVQAAMFVDDQTVSKASGWPGCCDHC